MLVLTRKENEAIVIGDGDCKIRVVVVEFNRRTGKLRLGIDAPRDIPVHREEVFDAIELAGGDMLRKKTNADFQEERDRE